MGRSKSKKQKANADEPGPDDFTYLAIFFPVGRNGAPLARDSDPEDQAAAQRIGMWMHHAGLPIRKLFSRKSEEHVLVEVREEVPRDVIDSKLGAYRWGDMLYAVREKDAASESTILRAKVKSHDAIEKMGGMVYFPISRVIPNAPKAQSPFKEVFPQPRRYSLTEPSTFSAIKYIPLPVAFREEDVKPNAFDSIEESKPDIKPDIQDVKPNINQDIKPGVIKEESKPSVSDILNTTRDILGVDVNDNDVKPNLIKPEEDQKPSQLPVNAEPIPKSEDVRPVLDIELEDTKPKVEAKHETIETRPALDIEFEDVKPNAQAEETELMPPPNLGNDEDSKPSLEQSESTHVATVDSNNSSSIKDEGSSESGVRLKPEGEPNSQLVRLKRPAEEPREQGPSLKKEKLEGQ